VKLSFHVIPVWQEIAGWAQDLFLMWLFSAKNSITLKSKETYEHEAREALIKLDQLYRKEQVTKEKPVMPEDCQLSFLPSKIC
jgi:hypothetical protein